ncbi:MAG: hypothetical protein ACRDPZ_03715 [Gaiellaceae bacterium]
MQSSRSRALAVVAVAVLAMSSVALAAGGLSGTYATTIKSPAQLKGKWALILAKGGTYTVAVNGQPVARGRYSSTATTITFDRERGSGCIGAGTYAWKKSGTTVTFVRKRESASCSARATVLSHRFTQVR